MSTKRDPGAFDCYAKLADDEPFFVLRGKDSDAPALVEQWADTRQRKNNGVSYPKLDEARVCAAQMRDWRIRNMSARPCGCDPGAKHQCEQHRTAESLESTR